MSEPIFGSSQSGAALLLVVFTIFVLSFMMPRLFEQAADASFASALIVMEEKFDIEARMAFVLIERRVLKSKECRDEVFDNWQFVNIYEASAQMKIKCKNLGDSGSALHMEFKMLANQSMPWVFVRQKRLVLLK